MRGNQVIVLSMSLSMWAACGKGETGDKAGAGAATGAAPTLASTTGATQRDACALVTQEDASTIFGMPAKKQTNPGTPDPAYLGGCDWTYQAPDNSNQLLQIDVWGKDSYYTEEEGAKPFAIGDKGYIAVSDLRGVDMAWVQKGQVVVLSLFSVGPSVPKATTKVEEMKALAKKVEAAF